MALILVWGPTAQANAFEFPDFSELSEGFAIGFDAVIVRPLYITSLVVGSIMLLPAIGMAALDGEESRDEAIELFVTIPYEDAIERELGDF